MDKIKVAIVGFGNIAKTHALSIYAANLKLNLPFELQLTHIVTSRSDSVTMSGVWIGKNIEDALEADDVDIIDICSRNNEHLAAVKTAAKYGKAIYCEKPLADNIGDAEKALDIVTQKAVKNGTPLIFRHLPCIHLLKRELEANRLGPVIDFKAKFYHKSYLSAEKRNSWRTDKDAGGGALLDLGIHLLDSIRLIFGEAKEVSHTKKIHFPGVSVDEISNTMIVMQNGVTGSLECSRVFAQRQQQLEITVFCEKGSFKCDLTKPFELEINDFNAGTSITKPNPKDYFMQYCISENLSLNYHNDAHIAAIADFACAVYNNSGSRFRADFKEAYASQLMTE